VRDLLWAALTLVAAYALCAAVFGTAAQGAPLASPAQATSGVPATMTPEYVATIEALQTQVANEHRWMMAYYRGGLECMVELMNCQGVRLYLPLQVRKR